MHNDSASNIKKKTKQKKPWSKKTPRVGLHDFAVGKLVQSQQKDTTAFQQCSGGKDIADTRPALQQGDGDVTQ